MRTETVLDIGLWTKRLFFAVVLLSMLVWSLGPSFTHSAANSMSVSAPVDPYSGHGHSPEDTIDTYWALHGHSHDVVDHDHNSAILTRNRLMLPTSIYSLAGLLGPFPIPPNPIYRLERPPRV